MKEEKKMRKGNFGIRRSLVSIAAAVVLIIGVTGGAYAADLGGFRNTVDTWLYGEPVQAEIEEVSEGNFVIHYPDGRTRETGGVYYDSEGNAHGVTEEDIIAELDYPEVVKNEDGTVFDSWHVAHGVRPNSHEAPVKADTAQYTYTFSGWSDGTTLYGPEEQLPVCLADAEYTRDSRLSVKTF